MAGGRLIRADGVQIGKSLHVTAINADQTVDPGDGILTHVTFTTVTAGTLQLREGTVAGPILATFGANTPAGTYQIGTSYSGGLHAIIAAAVIEAIIGMGGE